MASAEERRTRTKRSTQGCVTCVQAKVKCSEDRPRCQRCSRLHKECNWPGPRIPLKERRRGQGSLKSRQALGLGHVRPVACKPSAKQAERDAEQAEQAKLVSVIPPALSPGCMPSPSSVCYGRLEQDALYYFENIFSRLSPKTFLWSAHAILLKYSTDSGALMHLLLASSLSQMSQGHTNQSLLQIAKNHFSRGTGLLVADIQAWKIDHCRNMMAFWLLQLTYRTVWDQEAYLAMGKLSASMVSYIQDHKLIQLLCGAENSFDESLQLSPIEKSVIATFLLFAAYEDLDSQYCNSGGQLSAIILADPAVAKMIFTLSRQSHGRFFGTEYPAEELMDDIERSVPLELHLHANMALSNLQQVCREGDLRIEKLHEIASSLQDMEARYSTVFQLADAPGITTSKLMITTTHIVAHYYAVVVCLFKTMVTISGQESIAQSYSVAKQKLLNHVFRMVLLSPSPVPVWRNQWPIFIAAATAEDGIQSDWLLQKLGINRYSRLLNAERRTSQV